MSILYKSKYAPTHPHAMSNGCVYEYILVAELMIGRYLNPGETVHHWIKINNLIYMPEINGICISPRPTCKWDLIGGFALQVFGEDLYAAFA